MPAYTDTGLNLVHVDDVAIGHLLAMRKGKVGERYILGGENLMLKEILEKIARIVGRKPPRLKLPHGLITALAYVVEGGARLFRTGEPIVTIDSARMARHRMFFSSEKARRDLGFESRPTEEALRDAVEWFRANGYLN